MLFRYYKAGDFEQLIKLWKMTGIYYEPLDKKDILERQIQHDPESIILLEDAGRIVGSVIILYHPWNSFIYHLAVHADYQKQNLGKKLMDEAERRLKEKGMPRPTVFVEDDKEHVLEFYKKRGWKVLYKVFCLEKAL